MKQNIIPICPRGSHVTTPCLLGGWQNSWLGSEIFPSMSVFFAPFLCCMCKQLQNVSYRSVSNGGFLYTGTDISVWNILSPSVLAQSSFRPLAIIFLLFFSLEIFSLGTIIFFFFFSSWLAKELPQQRPWTICPEYLPSLCLFISFLLLGFIHLNFCF